MARLVLVGLGLPRCFLNLIPLPSLFPVRVQMTVPAADDRLGPGFLDELEKLTGVDGNASVFRVVNAALVIGRVNTGSDAEIVEQENLDVGPVAAGCEFNTHIRSLKFWKRRLG